MEMSDSFTLQPLYPWGNSLQFPVDRRLGGSWSWSGNVVMMMMIMSVATMVTIVPRANNNNDKN
jgi:hypothetical protein